MTGGRSNLPDGASVGTVLTDLEQGLSLDDDELLEAALETAREAQLRTSDNPKVADADGWPVTAEDLTIGIWVD